MHIASKEAIAWNAKAYFLEKKKKKYIYISNYCLQKILHSIPVLCVNEEVRKPSALFVFLVEQKKKKKKKKHTVKPQWLEHLWDHGNSFEIWVVRATEG